MWARVADVFSADAGEQSNSLTLILCCAISHTVTSLLTLLYRTPAMCHTEWGDRESAKLRSANYIIVTCIQ